jgi:tRNA-dihydrouridine synthase
MGSLPWKKPKPLILAPMQGVTNRALRGLFGEWVKPDVLFTEFLRVRPGSNKGLSQVDRLEAGSKVEDIPLVVQLIGRKCDALVAAAIEAQESGAGHININMGCPYGRMNPGSSGGALLRAPEELPRTLAELRKVVSGSFSVKMRAGYDDPGQVFSLLPLLEDCGVDFLVLHPRTVVQKYAGMADHAITTEVVRRTAIPVIANGDVVTAEQGRQLLQESGAAGLMLGRGAISDPLLFERIRGNKPDESGCRERAAEISYFLSDLLGRYEEIFCGDKQILAKIKQIVSMINAPAFAGRLKGLLRSKTVKQFQEVLQEFG